jgi:hypothetical protein
VFKLPLALLACAAIQAQAPALALVKAATPAPEQRLVSNLVLSHGRARFTLAQGQLSELRSGDRTLGYFFRGSGELEYTSTEAMELQAQAYNLQGSSGLKATATKAGTVLRRSFKEGVFWTNNVTFPALPAPQANPDAAKTREAYQDFRKSVDEMGALTAQAPGGGWSLHGTAVQLANFPRGTYLAAELTGGGEPLLYRRSDSGPGTEQLFACCAFRWYALSSQPVGWTWKTQPAPAYLLTHVDLNLETTGGAKATLKATETINAQVNGLKLVRLNQHNYIAEQRAVRDGGFISVLRVRDEQGRVLPFTHEGHTLLVELAQSLNVGQNVILTTELEGDFLFTPVAGNAWVLGARPWFPQPDAGGQFYTVRSRLRVPEADQPIAPGRTLKRTKEGGFNVLETAFDKPVANFAVQAGKFNLVEEVGSGRTLRVWTPLAQGAAGQEQKRIATTVNQIITAFEPMFGAWPFPEVNIIQSEVGDDQAPPATVYLPAVAFKSQQSQDPGNALAAASLPPSGGGGGRRGGGGGGMGSPVTMLPTSGVAAWNGQTLKDRIAQRVALQYWGQVVKAPAAEEQWITSSLAEYSSRLALQMAKNMDRNSKSRLQSMPGQWQTAANQALGAGTVHTAPRLFSDRRTEVGSFRTWLGTNKGAYLFYALHEQIGEDAFVSFLYNVQQLAGWKFCTTEALQQILQAVTKKDFTWYFDKYVWGNELPR